MEFAGHEGCQKAHAALVGRKFANWVVVTSFFDPIKYQQKNFVSKNQRRLEHLPWIVPGAGGLLSNIVTLVDYYQCRGRLLFSVAS